RPRANVALLNGVTLSPIDYTDEIVDGFQQMYHLLMREREVLLAAGGPQATLAGRQVRFIVRPTVTYAKLLAGALHPQHLRDGADRSIELDILGRPLLDTEARNPYWPLHRVEQRDLEQMDVPYFSVRADSDSLLLPGGEAIEQCFIETCANLAAARLRALDTEDLGRQLAFIRASLYTRTANEQGTTWPDHEPGMGVEADAPVSRDELLRLAARIAEELDTKAIRSNDGSVSWIGVSYIPQAERYQLQPLGPELYAGTVGVALFLAAFEQVSGGAGVRDLALGALQPLRRDLREHADRLVRVIGIGGAAGCGSLIYGLLQIGRLLGEADLVGDARRAAAALTEERIAQDRTLDLIGGAAGAILGLLTLYDVTGDATLLERAAVCGRHLLEQRADLAGQRAWKTLGGEALTGFSHGASGIGYALVRLYQRTGETGLLEATAEGFAYERSLFSSEEGNWRDLRGFKAQGRDGFQVSWCHGAPGIGLARLGALPVLDDEAIRQDLESALQTTEAFGARGVDQLCCGALGRAEILLQASQRLSRPELRDAALRQAAHVVRRAERDGHYRLQADLPEGVFSPSFFQGTAGIGYELLRLAYPDRLPSPLLWE
ncbi:MAG: type 2 lanthipeptide synthetase LanM, partial [Dehalococcoidia bacterium]